MLDIKYVRNNLSEVRRKLRFRSVEAEASLDNFEQLDSDHKQATNDHQTLLAEKNKLTRRVAQAKQLNQNTSDLELQSQQLNSKINNTVLLVKQLEIKLHDLMSNVPNLPNYSVPQANSASDNVLIKIWNPNTKQLNMPFLYENFSNTRSNP